MPLVSNSFPAQKGKKLTSEEKSKAVVLASGNLGLVYFTAQKERMSLEQINGAFHNLIPGIENTSQIVTIGAYRYIRHPMYAGGSLLFIGTPLALGSYWGLLAFVAVLPALIWRLLNEEKFLAKNLPGYADYCARVRWRLIPGIF